MAEKVTRNVGILRRALAGKGSRSLVESVVEEDLPHHQERPTLSRSYILGLIYDEEKAHVDYTQLAANPVFNEPQRELILRIADDEQRHHTILKSILGALEGEGKIV